MGSCLTVQPLSRSRRVVRGKAATPKPEPTLRRSSRPHAAVVPCRTSVLACGTAGCTKWALLSEATTIGSTDWGLLSSPQNAAMGAGDRHSPERRYHCYQMVIASIALRRCGPMRAGGTAPRLFGPGLFPQPCLCHHFDALVFVLCSAWQSLAMIDAGFRAPAVALQHQRRADARRA